MTMRRWRLAPTSRAGQLFALTALAVLLYVGAATGLSAIPGYDAVRHTLADVYWPWVLASLGGVATAFAGYLLAWRGLVGGAGAGGSLTRRQRRATRTSCPAVPSPRSCWTTSPTSPRPVES